MKTLLILTLLLALAGCATAPAPEPIDARAIRGEYMLNRAAIWTAEDAAYFETHYIDQ